MPFHRLMLIVIHQQQKQQHQPQLQQHFTELLSKRYHLNCRRQLVLGTITSLSESLYRPPLPPGEETLFMPLSLMGESTDPLPQHFLGADKVLSTPPEDIIIISCKICSLFAPRFPFTTIERMNWWVSEWMAVMSIWMDTAVSGWGGGPSSSAEWRWWFSWGQRVFELPSRRLDVRFFSVRRGLYFSMCPLTFPQNTKDTDIF